MGLSERFEVDELQAEIDRLREVLASIHRACDTQLDGHHTERVGYSLDDVRDATTTAVRYNETDDGRGFDDLSEGEQREQDAHAATSEGLDAQSYES